MDHQESCMAKTRDTCPLEQLASSNEKVKHKNTGKIIKALVLYSS